MGGAAVRPMLSSVWWRSSGSLGGCGKEPRGNHRVDLILLLTDALQDGVPRQVLHHRYRLLPRRLVRIALQHQPPRQFKRRGLDASVLFKAINQLPIGFVSES
jgi:hypothetical protein